MLFKRFAKPSLVKCIPLLCLFLLDSDQTNARVIPFHPDMNALSLGDGIDPNRLFESSTPECYTGESEFIISTPGADINTPSLIEAELFLVKDEQSVHEALNVSFGLSAQYSVVNINGNYRLNRQYDFNSNSVYWIVQVRYQYPASRLKNITRHPNRQTWTAANMLEACGPEFIFSRTAGHIINIELKLDTESQFEKEQIHADFSIDVNGVKGEGSLKSSLDKIYQFARDRGTLDVRIFGQGIPGGGDIIQQLFNTNFNNIDELMSIVGEKAQQFSRASAVVLSHETAELADFDQEIADDPVIKRQIDTLQELRTEWYKRSIQLEEIEDILNEKDVRNLLWKKEREIRSVLERYRDQIEQYSDSLIAANNQCTADAAKCRNIDQLSIELAYDPVIDLPRFPEVNIFNHKGNACYQFDTYIENYEMLNSVTLGVEGSGHSSQMVFGSDKFDEILENGRLRIAHETKRQLYSPWMSWSTAGDGAGPMRNMQLYVITQSGYGIQKELVESGNTHCDAPFGGSCWGIYNSVRLNASQLSSLFRSCGCGKSEPQAWRSLSPLTEAGPENTACVLPDPISPTIYRLDLSSAYFPFKDSDLDSPIFTTVDIPTSSPVASFTPQISSNSLTVAFSDQSTDATGWQWNFGDGGTSSEQAPSHIYAQAGTYTVQLTVTGPGGSNTTSQSITVTSAQTSASLTIGSTSAPAGGIVSIPISLDVHTDNVGVMQFSVQYDPSQLTPQETALSSIGEVFDQKSVPNTSIAGKVSFNFISLSGVAQDGTLATLNFMLAEGLSADAQIDLTVESGGSFGNASGNEITLNITNGRITISDGCAVLGDVNGSGRTDIFDALRLFQSVQVPPIGNPLAASEALCANVNCRGAVDIFDALLLFQAAQVPPLATLSTSCGTGKVPALAHAGFSPTVPLQITGQTHALVDGNMSLDLHTQPQTSGAITFEVEYDPDQLEWTQWVGPEKGAVTLTYVQLVEPGRLSVGYLRPQTEGNTSIAQLHFQPKTEQASPIQIASTQIIDINGQFQPDFRTSITVPSAIPLAFRLAPNVPNPFNPETTIRYEIPALVGQTQSGFVAMPVSLKIYNVTGQLVRTLVESEQAPGRYETVWNGLDTHNTPVASGVYIYRLQAADQVLVRRMSLLR